MIFRETNIAGNNRPGETDCVTSLAFYESVIFAIGIGNKLPGPKHRILR